MATLFSLFFGFVFFAFFVAALVGHALLLDALVRPFFAKQALPSRPVLTANGLLPQPAR